MNELLSLDLKNKDSAVSDNLRIGSEGEATALIYLKKNNYFPVISNFKIPIGRNSRGVQISGEIDIIALDGDCLCFIEVKTRSTDDFASPLAAVNLRKQRQIIRVARIYRKIFHIENRPFRYDVVSIVLNKKRAPAIELFKGFWTEEKFSKKTWRSDFYI